MRILLLPLTRRHTLLYAQRLTENESNKPSPWVTWALQKAQKTWADWGKSDTKWKSKTVETGNKLLDKIDWEEYALKTVHDPKTTTSEKVCTSGFEGNRRFLLCTLVGLRENRRMRLLRRW
jgi:Mitochondrial K+-H+ exchange-related